MAMLRALGYRPDKIDVRDYDFGRFGVTSDDHPAAASLRAYEPEVYDQGRTSSCVAQSMAGAIEMLERKAHFNRTRGGNTVPATPSRLFIYFNSRRMHSGGPAIFDNGTYLRTAAKGLANFGCPDEDLWHFSQLPWQVNRRPAFLSYMNAHGRRGGEYARINSTGEDRIRAIKGAIVAGFPVCFGTRVTDGFLSSSGPDVVDVPTYGDKFAGGHAMTIVGYNHSREGLVFDIRNSWGDRWRDFGHCLMTEDYIRWPHSSDFQIMRGWPNLTGNAA